MREIKFRAWDGDTTLGYKQHGYQKRKAEWHPHADSRGYVMEHRLIIENAIGRYLPKHAVIHHINGVRNDNRLENLEYMPEQAKHAKQHDEGKRNSNGQFVAAEPIFNEIKFRLFNKNTGLVQIMTLAKLMNTTFRNSQFEFRGRFTGLKDKNGKEIYEGDVMRILYTDWPSQTAEKNGRYSMSLEEYKKSISSIGFVQWENDRWVINFGKGRFGDDETGRMDAGPHGEKEIIGNIYENPELLKNGQ